MAPRRSILDRRGARLGAGNPTDVPGQDAESRNAWRDTPRHLVRSWYRGAQSPAPPGSVASQLRGTMVESRTSRGLEGLAARPLRWSVARALGQEHDHSPQHAVGEWSPEHRPRRPKGRNAADGPGRRAMSPPLPSVATALDSRYQVCSRTGAESSRRSTYPESGAHSGRHRPPDRAPGSPGVERRHRPPPCRDRPVHIERRRRRGPGLGLRRRTRRRNPQWRAQHVGPVEHRRWRRDRPERHEKRCRPSAGAAGTGRGRCAPVRRRCGDARSRARDSVGRSQVGHGPARHARQDVEDRRAQTWSRGMVSRQLCSNTRSESS